MIVLSLRTKATRAWICAGLMLLSACAREHTSEATGPSDLNALQDGDEIEDGGTSSSAGASGQGASGQSDRDQVTGGTNAASVVDGGESIEDAGSSVGAPVDAATPTSPATDAGPPHESFIGCRGPLDPGCAECKDGERSYHHAQEATDWYNVSSSEGSCEPDCPACASCSYRDEQAAIDLGRRPECEPCGDPGLDPCFGAGSCECYCSLIAQLSAACPTLY